MPDLVPLDLTLTHVARTYIHSLVRAHLQYSEMLNWNAETRTKFQFYSKLKDYPEKWDANETKL